MKLSNRFLALSLAVGTLFAAGGSLQAASVTIQNYSNKTIFVASAYNHKKGNVVTEGWSRLDPNEVRTFSAPDADKLCIRVINTEGREITWDLFKDFTNFPVHGERFQVSEPSDATNVRIMRHGANLEQSYNIMQGGMLPAGWRAERFFKVRPGTYTLRINPG